MLLKLEKRSIPTKGNGKLARSNITSRIHRKPLKIPSKKHPGKLHPGFKNSPGKKHLPRPTTSTIQCDNSNDSGLGFDQHLESHYNSLNCLNNPSTNCSNSQLNGQRPSSSSTLSVPKKSFTGKKFKHNSNLNDSSDSDDEEEISDSDNRLTSIIQRRTGQQQHPIDVDDACDNDYFYLYAQKSISHIDNLSTTCKPFEKLNSDSTTISTSSSSSSSSSSSIQQQQQRIPVKRPSSCNMSPSSSTSPSAVTSSTTTPPPPQSTIDLHTTSLHNQYSTTSRNNLQVQLQIITQPEQQHRARYQTEGSRGAVKDRTGNGFPVVKLNGYNKPTVLQVFIGTDVGRVSPHMFYQACKVSGKNSTPCSEIKTEGTMVIEIEMKPENDMTVVCDCVGILKERNVDVEHRFPNQSTSRNKKKSTKCRMVFRTKINDDEYSEILQICSQPITCTQPPGVPEICKKSLHVCSVQGGEELFIIGKNFLKDTKVIFVQYGSANNERSSNVIWEQIVAPDKEYLQQTHLICVVPPYANESIQEPINVQICVMSSNKKSEAHNFTYTPIVATTENGSRETNNNNCNTANFNFASTQQTEVAENAEKENVLMQWNDQKPATNCNDGIFKMPPPSSSVPLNSRNISSTNSSLSTTNNTNQQQSTQELPNEPTLDLKSEYIDENSMNSNGVVGDNSMDGCGSSPTVSTTTNPLVPTVKELLFEQKPSTALANFPLPSLMDVTQNLHPFGAVQQSANQSPVDLIQNQNFKVVDLRIKNEELQQEMSPHHLNQQQQNFMANFVNPVTPESLFQNTQQQMNENMLFATAQQQQQIIENVGQVQATPTPQMLAPSNMNHMMETSTSLTTQDIILNSQSAVVLNGGGSIQKQQGDQPMPEAPPNNIASTDLSSNVILNPTISPSMMCQNEQNLLTSVPMDTNPMLTMNNMIQSIPLDTVNQTVTAVSADPNTMATESMDQTVVTAHHPTSPPVAVKNMILNAAAEILTSQEPSPEAQSTINAIMMHTLNQPEVTPSPQTMMYSTEMPPPPIPPPSQTNQTNMSMSMSLIAHKMNVIAKTELTSESLLKSHNQHNRGHPEQLKQTNPTQSGIMNASTPNTVNPLSQPFSPTTQDLTTMSDNDLISFINPTLFGENII